MKAKGRGKTRAKAKARTSKVRKAARKAKPKKARAKAGRAPTRAKAKAKAAKSKVRARAKAPVAPKTQMSVIPAKPPVFPVPTVPDLPAKEPVTTPTLPQDSFFPEDEGEEEEETDSGAPAKMRPPPGRASPAGGRTAGTGAAVAGMDDAGRIREMIGILSREYPDARCMLDFSNAFELLVATILAAQCTDAMVNEVTKTLFARYPTPRHYVDASQEELEQAIYKTGFFRQKTKSLKKCCQALLEKHNGEVPRTMEELTALGGVGRKTANCVLGNAFGVPGIVVDTHVRRLARRMGYTAHEDPDKIEADLAKIAPHEEWTHLSHLLADHGRQICAARKPLCPECPVEHLCPKILE